MKYSGPDTKNQMVLMPSVRRRYVTNIFVAAICRHAASLRVSMCVCLGGSYLCVCVWLCLCGRHPQSVLWQEPERQPTLLFQPRLDHGGIPRPQRNDQDPRNQGTHRRSPTLIFKLGLPKRGSWAWRTSTFLISMDVLADVLCLCCKGVFFCRALSLFFSSRACCIAFGLIIMHTDDDTNRRVESDLDARRNSDLRSWSASSSRTRTSSAPT